MHICKETHGGEFRLSPVYDSFVVNKTTFAVCVVPLIFFWSLGGMHATDQRSGDLTG